MLRTTAVFCRENAAYFVDLLGAYEMREGRWVFERYLQSSWGLCFILFFKDHGYRIVLYWVREL